MEHSRHSLRAGGGLRVDAAASDSATAPSAKISVRHKPRRVSQECLTHVVCSRFSKQEWLQQG